MPKTDRRVTRGLALAACLLTLPAAARPGADGPAPSAEGTKYFETHVRPVLQAHCVRCHGGEKPGGGLSLTGRVDALKGGEHGAAVTPGKPAESLLLKAVSHAGELKMPPKGKLAQAQIDALTKWVEMGAPWPDGEIRHAGPPPVDDRARNFWSFRPVARPTVPAVKRADWVKTPIDAFVLAKLEAAGLQPAPPAEKTTLLRRVYYDLTGLPPSPAEVEAFLKDAAPDAYEKVVDRLLASPAYGERRARHWLDLVRYAETNGYEFDTAKPHVWRYRDYVINSFNDDKPYTQFVKEQLAGDELDRVTPETLVATGFYRLGAWDGGAPDRLQATYDELDDILATTGQVFLGLTVQCARCHDHKIDPFPQKDYYRLLAFVHNVQRYNPRTAVRTIGDKADAELQKQEIAAFKERLAEVERQMKAIEDALRPHLTGGEKDDFEHAERRQAVISSHVPQHVTAEDYERYAARVQEKAQLERKQPSGIAQALCVSESGSTPQDTFVFARGDPRSRGDKVEPGFPSVLTAKAPSLPAPAAGAKTAGRRRVLAEWIASPDNPLTARVMVNRIWQHHFGRGIVRSSSDFGYRGTPPTHPELLDWLAAEFVEPTWANPERQRGGAAPGGEDAAADERGPGRGTDPLAGARGSPTPWSLKRLHKLIVTSNAYRMSSNAELGARNVEPKTTVFGFPVPRYAFRNPRSVDPENDLFWRFDLRRLSAEEVRDSILAASGNLNRSKVGGPSIYPHIQREVLQGQSMPGVGWRQSPPEEANRRSVYVHVKRSLPVPFLNVFDAPDPDSSCPARFTTTQPTQALAMLNGEFLNAQAKVFADGVRKAAGEDPAAQVRLALRRVTQREPTAKEVERGVAFMARLRETHQRSAADALRDFCLLALNLNEFVYLD